MTVKEERDKTKEIIEGWKKAMATYKPRDPTPEEHNQLLQARLQEEYNKHAKFTLP